MKKILILSITLSFNLLFANTINNNTIINTKGYSSNGKNHFVIGQTKGICLNNTVYYIEGEGRSSIMAISHNPITKHTYYCEVVSNVKAKKQDRFTSGTFYEQKTIIYHTYTQLILQK